MSFGFQVLGLPSARALPFGFFFSYYRAVFKLHQMQQFFVNYVYLKK